MDIDNDFNKIGLQAGQIFKMKARSRGVYYLVVDDYGTLRPLILSEYGELKKRPFLNAKVAVMAGRKGASKPFYEGDEYITDSIEEFLRLVSLSQLGD